MLVSRLLRCCDLRRTLVAAVRVLHVLVIGAVLHQAVPVSSRLLILRGGEPGVSRRCAAGAEGSEQRSNAGGALRTAAAARRVRAAALAPRTWSLSDSSGPM